MASERLDRELRHVLRRCPLLEDSEIRLLALVASYSKGCLLSYQEICKLTNWSRSKLIRTIRSLEKRRLIEVNYRTYKRTTIKIAPAWRQLEFVKTYNVPPVTQESYPISEITIGHEGNHEMSPMTQPILEREVERNIENTDKNNLAIEGLAQVDVRALISSMFPSMKQKIYDCSANSKSPR